MYLSAKLSLFFIKIHRKISTLLIVNVSLSLFYHESPMYLPRFMCKKQKIPLHTLTFN